MLLNLPLRVRTGKKKDFLLNLNNYRNAHYYTLNNAKAEFKRVMESEIKKLPRLDRIRLTYTLFPKTQHKMDVANVCSIADKFFCDALVEFGKLEDDNYEFIDEVDFRFGHIDKSNPRVEVLIEPSHPSNTSEQEQDHMQITLNQDEIHTALQEYVRTQINLAEGMEVSIEMTAGRGPNGYSATLDIRPAGLATAGVKPAEKPKAEAKPKPAGGLLAGKSKPAPEKEPEVVNVADEDEKDIQEHIEEDRKEDAAQEEAASNISSGEERVDPAEQEEQTTEPEQEPEPEEEVEQPAPKGPSLFNFKKPAKD